MIQQAWLLVENIQFNPNSIELTIEPLLPFTQVTHYQTKIIGNLFSDVNKKKKKKKKVISYFLLQKPWWLLCVYLCLCMILYKLYEC